MDYFKLYSELMQLYTNGLFYSTIVLSGVLCERICYDILSRQRIMLENGQLSEEQIACLYELNLRYLIELLSNWRLIKEETRLEMIKINDKRNEYVHPKESGLNARKDSLEMMKMITKILANEFEVRSAPQGWVTLI
jgi:hypothetical protein